METVVSPGVPAVASVGSVPKESFTFSPDSARVSSVAETSKVCEVSPASNVTFSGTPEWSEAEAPPSLVVSMGMVTVRSGSARRG